MVHRERFQASEQKDPTDPQEWDLQEWRQMLFDYHKQLATLSGAGVVVLLAIYDKDIIGQNFITFALTSFALSALASVYGMWIVLDWFPYRRPIRRPYTPWHATLALTLLTLAVWSVLASAFDLREWVAVGILAVIALLAAIWFLFKDKLRARLSR